MSLSLRAPLMVLGLILTLSYPGRAAMLINADFETDPAAAGWSAEPAEGQPAPAWTTETAHSGSHALVTHGGTWRSPAFAVTPYEYYRLDFWAKGQTVDYFAAQFKNADGAALEADHYSGLDANGDWTAYSLCFRVKAAAATGSVIFSPRGDTPLYVDDVTVRPVTRAEATAWADECYAAIPPVRFIPPADRFTNLARSFDKLRQGGTLRVVMLGDSIINDTGSSPWDLLVERMYPGSRLEVHTSVSGGKGCWYYRENGRVQSYILDFAPDLLIIGGISQGGRIFPIRDVIREVRKHSTTEILLMTGAFGKGTDPRVLKWYPGMDIDPQGYADNLRCLAAEESCGFFDLRTAWAQYLMGVKPPYEWFMRDPVHANDRGRAFVARIIAGFFTP